MNEQPTPLSKDTQSSPKAFSEINKDEETLRNELESLLSQIRESKLSEAQLEKKLEDSVNMIKYYNELTNSIEDRRIRIYENSLTILGVVVTACTILASINARPWFLPPVVIFLILLGFAQLHIIIVYYRQNNKRYCFNSEKYAEYSNRLKWFYYGNSFITKIDIRKEQETDFVNYISGLKSLVEYYKDKSNGEILADNIIQIYLLQVHNYYKNKEYLALAKIQRNWFIFTIIMFIVFFIIA